MKPAEAGCPSWMVSANARRAGDLLLHEVAARRQNCEKKLQSVSAELGAGM